MPLFLRPRTLDEAVAALGAPGVQILAGGTDFFPALGERQVATPVVDITAIPELSGITVGDGEIRIAGGTTWTEVIRAPLPACCDALKAAMAQGVRSVDFGDRRTEFHSLEEMERLLARMEAEVAAAAATTPRPRQWLLYGSKGT